MSDTRADRSAIFVTLGVLMMFSSIATDLYLPAIPAMARSLNATSGMIEGSIATYLAGFVLGQLVWGPVSDAKGRKRPVLLGIAIFIAGTVGCALAGSAEAILIWRAVQGFGGSAAVVIARTIVSDLFDEDRAARALSSLIAIMALAPMIGPLLGAQLLAAAGWRAIFWTLFGFAAFAFVLTVRLPESHPAHRRSSSLCAGILRYGSVAREREVLRFAITGSCFYAGLFAFIAAGPTVFIGGYGFSESLFAILLAMGTVFVIAANLVNVRLIERIGYRRSLRIGAMICGFAALAALTIAILAPARVEALVAALMAYMAMAGLIVANALTGAVKAVARDAGSASAFAGAMNFAGGAAGAFAVATIAPGSVVAFTAVLAVCGVLTALVALPIPNRGDAYMFPGTVNRCADRPPRP